MRREFVRAALASAVATAAVLAGTGVPAAAAAPVLTLSNATGPSGGGGAVTGTVPSSAVGPFAPGFTPTVQFQYVGTGSTSCSASASEVAQIAVTGTTATAGVLTVKPETVRRLSPSKIAFEVPSSEPDEINPDGLVLADAQTTARWNICVYDSDATVGGNLLATASYTLVPRPLITGIFPASSSAVGGQSITVTGRGFSAVGGSISGSIGGVNLTGIMVADNGTSFTAVTGARAAEAGLALTVDTPGGMVSSLDPDGNGQPEDNDPSTDDVPIPFTYSNGIRATPNTAVAGTKVDVDVIGAGFSELTFSDGGLPIDGNAHVFLVRDAYLPGSNRGVAECTDVVIVNDTELICTLDLAADQLNAADSSVMASTPIPDGAYVLTVVVTGDPAAGLPDAKPTIISSGAVFVVAPY
jgi:hypothetical protein